MSEMLIVPGNQEAIAGLEIGDSWMVYFDGRAGMNDYVDRMIRNVIAEHGKRRFDKIEYSGRGILVVRKM